MNKALIILCLGLLLADTALSQIPMPNDSLLCIYQNKGKGVFAIPDSLVSSVMKFDDHVEVTIDSDSVITFFTDDIDSISYVLPIMPQFTSFKINNKYNTDLSSDVFCQITDSEIIGDMGYMIGKDLRPSFQTDVDAFVSVAGKLQESKYSRLRFNSDVTYTVSPDTVSVMLQKKLIHTEVTADSLLEIPLSSAMVSTNAPSNSGHGPDQAVDDNISTYYHSTYSGDAGRYPLLPMDSCPYIEISLPYEVRKIVLYYRTRTDTGARQPLTIKLYGSENGVDWKLIKSLDATDGIPQVGAGAEFTSTVIDMGKKMGHVRVEMTLSNYKNYFCLSELKLYEPRLEEEEEIPDYYQYFTTPLGRDYNVKLQFRADTATVPRMDIDIDGGQTVTNKINYLHAKFSLKGNGMYEDVEDSVYIRGRGNSSWGGSKRPYRIKFDESIKLCGLKKGKNWNLMANAQDVTEMMNATIFKAGRLVESAYSVHSIPIELYVNGLYYGSYAITEHIGIHNNCVDEDDYSQFIELDSYFDEPYRFQSTYYQLPVNVKNPDFSDPQTPITLNEVKIQWNDFERVLKNNGDVGRYLNIDSFAKYMVMVDLSGNTEINHPKSTFLYKPTGGDKYIFGPGWDYDWGFGFEVSGRYFGTYSYETIGSFSRVGTVFFKKLLQREDVMRAYYFTWKKFLENDGIEELLNWMDDYFAYASPSMAHSASIGKCNGGYATYFKTMKTWLENRVDYIYRNLTAFDDPVTGIPGDMVDDSNQHTIDDGMTISVRAGALFIESNRAETLDIFRTDGRKIGKLKVEIGENIYPLAPRGHIIVGQKQIYLKPL